MVIKFKRMKKSENFGIAKNLLKIDFHSWISKSFSKRSLVSSFELFEEYWKIPNLKSLEGFIKMVNELIISGEKG